MRTETRTCPVCGDPYTARTADLQRGWAKTCSKSCAAIARTRRESRGNFKVAPASARYSTRPNDTRPLDSSLRRDLSGDYEGGGWDAYKRY